MKHDKMKEETQTIIATLITFSFLILGLFGLVLLIQNFLS